MSIDTPVLRHTMLQRSPLRSALPDISDVQWRTLRWIPFVATALFSLVMSALTPDGRRPFHIECSLSLDALEFSIVKAPHISACALLAALAVVGAGRRRWPLALLLTVAVGAGWELCQTTVVGHYARLSDLAPDTLGALIGCMLATATLWTIESSSQTSGQA